MKTQQTIFRNTGARRKVDTPYDELYQVVKLLAEQAKITLPENLKPFIDGKD
jgi:hypothetical protein